MGPISWYPLNVMSVRGLAPGFDAAWNCGDFKDIVFLDLQSGSKNRVTVTGSQVMITPMHSKATWKLNATFDTKLCEVGKIKFDEKGFPHEGLVMQTYKGTGSNGYVIQWRQYGIPYLQSAAT